MLYFIPKLQQNFVEFQIFYLFYCFNSKEFVHLFWIYYDYNNQNFLKKHNLSNI